ncbi:putative cardiolipin synthase YwiE [Rubripirellula lacrimiformis]|uniref:Cardiolipin synthase n=1 Tax=Rubripirellula lacrimiformis TaxID=1930273 RepID=A0A517N4R2_9BACT|nr:cardiolipin synthase [Rubripirellula lacrimiformis]QDT02126.1 putative cardiolipin synthase YwiE [Rubripirellula lacrimiformis]
MIDPLQYLDLDVSPEALLIPAALLFIHSLAVVSAFHSLLHVRTSQAAIAWVVGLVTIPYVTLPLYWMFSRHRFEGYREAIREVGDQHQHSVTAIRRELFTEQADRPTLSASSLSLVASVLETPISAGNEFRLLIDGKAFFDAMLMQIQSAERYVYASFYIIRDDQIGNQFADALIQRARAGVTVRLLYDEVGCLRLSNGYLRRLVDAGVDVHSFNTRQGWVNRFQVNFRNHRKLLVVDGKRAIVGGLNVGDEYLGDVPSMSPWRDTSVEVVGNLTRKIQAVFAGDYYWAARSNLPEADWQWDPDHDVPDPQDVSDAGDTQGLAVACATGPADHRPRAVMMFAAAIGAAKERLWISTPYLVPDDALLVALAMAKSRGVDVRLLIPTVADQWAVYLAGFYYERELAEIGVPVFRYTEGMLHQKCVLVDDSLALIGSTNFDNRSLYLNFELLIAIADRPFVSKVAAMLDQDFDNAKHSNQSGRPLRPWFARAGTAVARLFSPVL